MSTTGWLITIVIAGGLLAFANLQYQRSRDAERDAISRQREETESRMLGDESKLVTKRRASADEARDEANRQRERDREVAAAAQVRLVLRPEIVTNLALIDQIETDLQQAGAPPRFPGFRLGHRFERTVGIRFQG